MQSNCFIRKCIQCTRTLHDWLPTLHSVLKWCSLIVTTLYILTAQFCSNPCICITNRFFPCTEYDQPIPLDCNPANNILDLNGGKTSLNGESVSPTPQYEVTNQAFGLPNPPLTPTKESVLVAGDGIAGCRHYDTIPAQVKLQSCMKHAISDVNSNSPETLAENKSTINDPKLHGKKVEDKYITPPGAMFPLLTEKMEHPEPFQKPPVTVNRMPPSFNHSKWNCSKWKTKQ